MRSGQDGIGPALRVPSLRDQVYSTLRRQISEGTFPEEGMIEADLSETLGVSRTPVREALFQLCREGMLRELGRGYHLPKLKPQEHRNIAEVREVLDPRWYVSPSKGRRA